MGSKYSLVTAVIPSYNHANYIGAALEGLINQTYPHIELIILDDHSSDDSDSVINSYKARCEARFVKFTYIRKSTGKGLCDSLNTAIDMADGEYLYVNGSDDISEPAAIATLVGFLDANEDYVLAVGDSQLIDASGTPVYWDSSLRNVYDKQQARFLTVSPALETTRDGLDFRQGDFGQYQYLLFGNHIPNGYLQRKSAVVEVGKYDQSIMIEDWSMQLRLARKYKMKWFDTVLFRYRWHDTNTMRRKIAVDRSNLKTLKKEKKFAYELGFAEQWNLSYRLVRARYLRELRHWLLTFHTAKRRRQIRIFGFYLVRPPAKR